MLRPLGSISPRNSYLNTASAFSRTAARPPAALANTRNLREPWCVCRARVNSVSKCPSRRETNATEGREPIAFRRRCGRHRRASFCWTLLAQGTTQTVPLVRVDVKKLATGYRWSKIVGSSVVNQNDDKIGTVDIVEPSEKVPFAILSVDGFLGVGEHLVAVPFNSLRISRTKSSCRVPRRRNSRHCPSSNTQRSDAQACRTIADSIGDVGWSVLAS
jgi:PRC-barrel domain